MRCAGAIGRLAALAAVWAAGAARAADDSYASGFYTRGVDAAAAIDQGGPVAEPFYVPARTGALLPRASVVFERDDNVFLDPSNGTERTTAALVPGLLAIWGRPAGNHVYADYGLILPIYDSEDDASDDPSHLLRLGSVFRTGKSQLQAQLGYRRLEDVDTVVGARVSKRDWIGDLSAEHRISGKSSVGLQGNVEIHEFDADAIWTTTATMARAGCITACRARARLFAQAAPAATIRGARIRPPPPISATCRWALRGKQSPKFNATGGWLHVARLRRGGNAATMRTGSPRCGPRVRRSV
jgi:hypothetical protein